ncbi:hypothetical protein ACQKTA_13515 (plasmid) [Enterococcus sp. 22-H-5-01]|uniref:hypothetical protein n=1 Tax=Enterococcus sp. 22-H-5-01 TaxID=3418555 RepID=UPI003D0793BA
MVNLKYFSPDGGSFTDLRPLQTLTKLETLINLGIFDKANLDDLILLDNLKEISLDFNGHIADNMNTKPNALLDISALSGKNNLEQIYISGADGYLPTVSMSKKNKNYTLIDPVILSDQFKEKIVYDIDLIQNEPEDGSDCLDNEANLTVTDNNELIWENIPSDTEYLLFSAHVNEGNFSYNADNIKIPIRWLD